MVTGLGLGVWMKTAEQRKLYLQAFQRVLLRNNFEQLSTIDFRLNLT